MKARGPTQTQPARCANNSSRYSFLELWGSARKRTLLEIQRQRWQVANDVAATESLLDSIGGKIALCVYKDGIMQSFDHMPAASRALLCELRDVLSKVVIDHPTWMVLLLALQQTARDNGEPPREFGFLEFAVDVLRMFDASRMAVFSTASKLGRPPRANLAGLVWQLANFYHRYSARRPAATEGGPFERFVKAVLSAEVLKAPNDPRRLIREAVREWRETAALQATPCSTECPSPLSVEAHSR